MWSVTTRPSTASPRNSSRSFDSWPGCSAHHDRCASAAASFDSSTKGRPRRSFSASRPLTGSRTLPPTWTRSGSGLLQSRHDVVDGVAHGLQVGEILVIDVKTDRAFTQLFLQGLHQFDEGERVGVEVV